MELRTWCETLRSTKPSPRVSVAVKFLAGNYQTTTPLPRGFFVSSSGCGRDRRDAESGLIWSQEENWEAKIRERQKQS